MSELTAWEHLQIVRNKERPTVLDYIPLIFDDFYECRGDRLYSDDRAIIGGIARFHSIPVTIIAQVKERFRNQQRAIISLWPIQKATVRRCV